ncbi:MAG: GNAT family N-acetyltransferase [Acidimicrobiia bacterium]
MPDDRALFAEGLRQMSLASRFARFGSGVASLGEAELRYLTEVDQVSHVAWGATIDGQPAGVGRYIVDAAADAEIAITVVDRFQRIGLGRALFDALVATARAGGLETFRFAIEPWNRSVLRMLPGVDIVADETDGMLGGRIEIAELPPGERVEEFVTVIDSCRRGGPGREPPAQRSGSGAGSRSNDAELMQ